jgi:hypothetical protein
MTTMREFMDMCKRYEQVWILEGNTLMTYKNQAIKVVHFDKRSRQVIR